MPVNLDDLRREKRNIGKHSILVCYPSQDGSEKEIKHRCKTEDISEGGLNCNEKSFTTRMYIANRSSNY